MLKFNIKIATLVAALALVGCEKDMEITPFASKPKAQIIVDENDVRSLVNGGYEALSSSHCYGARWLMNAELYGADPAELRWRGTFADPRQFYNKFILTTNADATTMWTHGYNLINNMNHAIESMSLVKDEALRNQLEGEAKLLRAIAHFELLRFYGKAFIEGGANNETNSGVPLMVKSDNVGGVVRASVAEVYAAIEKDMKEAEEQLPARTGVVSSSRSIFADKSVAAAFLSRVYLQQYKYEQARDAADRVIASNNYGLMVEPEFAYNSAAVTREDVFVIASTAQDNVNSMYAFFGLGRNGDVEYLAGMLNQFPTGDKRRTLFRPNPANGRVISRKWNEANNANVNVIRLAEMHLTRAEANFALNESKGATPLEDINLIRVRAGLAPLTTLTIADIRRERKLELIAEGHLIHDLKRWKLSVRGRDASNALVTMPYTSPALVAPIPQRDINVNPNLKQNAGY
jgi:hypothetical protein